MDQSGSFIPQQTKPRPKNVRRRRVYVLSYVAYTIFIGALLTTVGVVVWNWQVVNQLEQQQSALAEERTKFEQSDIIEVQEVESLLAMVAYLLDTQPAISTLLTALEDTTVRSVQLQEFNLTQTEAGETGLTEPNVQVTYVGVADSFNTVLAQRNVMQSNPLLEGAVISAVTYGADQESSGTPADTLSENPVSYEVTLALPVSTLMFAGSDVSAQFEAETLLPAAESSATEDAEETEAVPTATTSAESATSSNEINS